MGDVPSLTMPALARANEELVDAIHGYLHEVPTVRRDAGIADRCGPIAFGFAVYLRANSLPGGLIHVTGTPHGFAPSTGHYLTTSGEYVIDLTYRQFDASAPLPVLYRRADLTGPPEQWRPWTAISGELAWDDPLYPDFVDYPGCQPLTYLAPGTDDPQWVTPYDER